MAQQGLKVNFSTEEASSEARSFDPIPTGMYDAIITDIEERESKSEKNNGKPYWHVELTIQGGEYDLRKVWANVMLFDGALYSLAQLLKATGHEDAIQKGVVPPMETFVTKKVVVSVKKQRDTYAEKEENGGDGTPQWKNEVKGFKAPGDKPVGSAKGSSGKASLLP
jgi:hypothetical protein